MSFSSSTPNYALRLWSSDSDSYDNADLVFNFSTIDTQLALSRPTNKVGGSATLPTLTGGDAGSIYYLTAATGGFPASSIVRWDGSAWKNVGPIEMSAAVPATGTSAHFSGRLVMLTAADSGFSAWTLLTYNGATASWQRVGAGVDVIAPPLPTVGNTNGRMVVINASTTEPTNGTPFAAYDVLCWNGTVWNRVGPPPQSPEATTIAALTTLSPPPTGFKGLVTAGATPYDFTEVTYSGLLSKWISPGTLFVSQNSTTTTTSTTFSDLPDAEFPKPYLAWKTRDTAGLKPQFRLITELVSDTGGQTSYAMLAARAVNAGGNPGAFAAFTAGAATVSTTGVTTALADSGWVDLPTLTVSDFVNISVQTKTSNVSAVASCKHSTVYVRWISKP